MTLFDDEKEKPSAAMTCLHMKSHPSHEWRTRGWEVEELIFCKGRGNRRGLIPTREEANGE